MGLVVSPAGRLKTRASRLDPTLVAPSSSRNGWFRATEANSDELSVLYTITYERACIRKAIKPLVTEFQHVSR